MDVGNIKKACTETLILHLLRSGPLHGYEMAKEVDRQSSGYFRFKHGTLYPILHRMEKAHLIEGEWSPEPTGRPRKRYKLTESGRRYHGENTEAWREFLATLTALIPELGMQEG